MSKQLISDVTIDIHTMSDDELEEKYFIKIYDDGVVDGNEYFASLEEWAEWMESEFEEPDVTFIKRSKSSKWSDE